MNGWTAAYIGVGIAWAGGLLIGLGALYLISRDMETDDDRRWMRMLARLILATPFWPVMVALGIFRGLRLVWDLANEREDA